jgi:hypothetical protein
MDCTVYDWEAAVDARSRASERERRAQLESNLKRAFPMIVDERFMEILRALDGEEGEITRGRNSP